MRSRSLTGLVVGLFGATAVVVGVILVAVLVSVTNLRDSDRTVRQSADLLARSLTGERSVVELDTELRGFLLTRQAGFLRSYAKDQSALAGQLKSLRGLANDPTEERRIRDIASGVGSYVSGYAKPLAAAGSRLSDSAKRGAAARGEQLLGTVHNSFRLLDTRILRLSEKQRESANSAASQAISVAAVGLVVAILFLLAAGFYLLRRVLRPIRRVATAAERVAGGELAVRVPQGGHGEVARLGHSFNEMAVSLQHHEDESLEVQHRLAEAAAAAEEASAMKSNFLANMSHETRTPLNGVIGMLSLLSDTQLTSEQSEYVEVARTSSDALMMVVNDVLDIAKIEAGRLEIERRDFDLPDVVEAVCDMVAASAVSKGIELQSFVHEDVPRAVRGDRMRVAQVLANLVSNAVKFTADGEVAVEVSVLARAEDSVRVRFDVRDTGIGIAADRVEHLFEPFVQAEAGTTREYGGTGLGLTISRELTVLMGGTIEAESELGKGSSFRVELAFAPATAGPPAPVPAAELRGLHVLVVDDNQTNRRVFEAYVASWGMRPEVARDAVEGFALLRQGARTGDPFDVALLDFNMPGENGLELAARIRRSPSLAKTHLILLTSAGHLDGDEPERGLAGHLTKPVRQSRLLDAISAAMAAGAGAGLAAGIGVASARELAPSVHAGARILVAEDQAVNWKLIERMLSRRGLEASNAVDGRQALRMLDAAPYDLVLMDCHMPSLDGYDTAREIRRREADSGADRIPIVAMTANAMLGDREQCLGAGMDDYMAKPISLDALDEVLARWLSPAGSHGDSGLLEQARLSELRTLFPGEEMSAMMRDLVVDVDAELERVDAGVSDSDQRTVASAAHRIKNSARMIGAHRLADAAASLGSADGVIDATAVEALRREWRTTRTAIEAEVTEVASG